MDWCDGGPVGPLARLSYSLHKSLASELNQDTGYREVRTFSVAASAKPGESVPLHLGLLCAAWVAERVHLMILEPLLQEPRWAASVLRSQPLERVRTRFRLCYVADTCVAVRTCTSYMHTAHAMIVQCFRRPEGKLGEELSQVAGQECAESQGEHMAA